MNAFGRFIGRLLGFQQPPESQVAQPRTLPPPIPIEFGINSETGGLCICVAVNKEFIAGSSREDSVKLANDIINWTAPEKG